MWKKIMVTVGSILISLSAIYFVNQGLQAEISANSESEYYDVGDKFAKLNSTRFAMGNYFWQIIEANQETGYGYILSDRLVVDEVGCGSGYAFAPANYDLCLTAAQKKYEDPDHSKYAGSVECVTGACSSSYPAYAGETDYIGKIPSQWKPDKDCTSKQFVYDTMKDLEPLLNIGAGDSDYPSINIDTDGDGIPDINIDTDGDGIPDVDIDGDGDGKSDIKVDTDGDGIPDKNIMDITEWKPGLKVEGDVPYYTSEIKFKKPNETRNDEPTNVKPSVKGQYNPVTSIGGANTGDDSDLMLYLSFTMLSIGFISYALYKYQKNTF